MKVQITFTPEGLKAANEARARRGLPLIEEGPLFENVYRVRFDGSWVRILCVDETDYAYSANVVARVKQFE